jgi:hypothetical protein
MRRILLLAAAIATMPFAAYGAYHHGGDTDSDIALQAYPAIAGTKLDSCALCHTGGQYEKKKDVWVQLGSCQWCHYSYGYDQSGNIVDTLNEYGRAYSQISRTAAALLAIAGEDADGDGFSNGDEIAALRFPGNGADDPTKVAAPCRVLSLEELEAMPVHSQVMLMNTHKSGDYYAEYSGVPLADLLDDTGILPSATGITVFAPDGWAQYHPLEPDDEPLMYHVYGSYPGAQFFYIWQADDRLNPDGWCNYSSPHVQALNNGDPIEVEGGLKMILAFARDGYYLEPGRLTADNKLDGEGPFRVVPPQKTVGPPDQSSVSKVQDVVWPFDENADHNAGFSTRSATMIRVEPLPADTTDVDILEAGWNYVDEGKILVYGAIDPLATLDTKIDGLQHLLHDMSRKDFSTCFARQILSHRLSVLQRLLRRGQKRPVAAQLDALVKRTDGCINSGRPDRDDWLRTCNGQTPVYWAIHELKVLLAIDN